MDAKSRREQERLEGKKLRRQKIVEAAERVFLQKGIENATMQDIADEEKVGVATVFRYFPKKEMLIIEVASNIVETEFFSYRAITGQPGTGLEKLEKMLDAWIGFVQARQDHLKFLEFFDNYVANKGMSPDIMERYEDVFQRLTMFEDVLREGIKDGSIRQDADVTEVIATVSHSLMSLAQKLALRGKIIRMDSTVEPARQLQMLKEAFLEYLKNKA